MSIIKKDVSFEGKNVMVRTVSYHYTGRCVLHSDEFVVLEDAAWIADSGRWATALGAGSFSEVEPYPDGMQTCIAMGAVVEIFEWPHALPREQK